MKGFLRDTPKEELAGDAVAVFDFLSPLLPFGDTANCCIHRSGGGGRKSAPNGSIDDNVNVNGGGGRLTNKNENKKVGEEEEAMVLEMCEDLARALSVDQGASVGGKGQLLTAPVQIQSMEMLSAGRWRSSVTFIYPRLRLI